MLVDVAGIPIRFADGSLIYVLVDPEDFATLNEWRWSPSARGRYASRAQRYHEMPVGVAPGRVLMHREIMGLNSKHRLVVDHINGNGFDNRRANLRVLTRGENTQNVGSRLGARSAFRGVFFNPRLGRKKWVAQGAAYGRKKTIGYFDTEVEAAAAAALWRSENMPYSREALAS